MHPHEGAAVFVGFGAHTKAPLFLWGLEYPDVSCSIGRPVPVRRKCARWPWLDRPVGAAGGRRGGGPAPWQPSFGLGVRVACSPGRRLSSAPGRCGGGGAWPGGRSSELEPKKSPRMSTVTFNLKFTRVRRQLPVALHPASGWAPVGGRTTLTHSSGE